MGKIKELLLEEQMDLFESFDELQKLDYSEHNVDVTFEDFDMEYTEISLEDFEQMHQGSLITNEDYMNGYARDWMVWEETTPLTSPTESDMLRKEIAELTETLYAQYKRVAELTDEVASLKARLEKKLHNNTRTY